MFDRRPDATVVRDLPAMRRFMPYISPRRNDSVFYMFQDIGVDAALEFLEKRNRERPADRQITLFHLFLRSTSHAVYVRPGTNRFVKGGKVWQRDGEWLSFSAKREIKDGSPMLTIKRRFHPTTESLDAMVDDIYDRLESARSGRKSTSDKEMGLLLRLPGFVIKLLLGLLNFGDRFGLVPRSMIDADPLYTSVFVANLGSINYPAGFHHLWEYGTTSIFGVMGRIEPSADGRKMMRIAWTYDERIEDGLYSYYTLEGIKHRIENPELLDETAKESERV
jgi:hypothetical protein